MFELNIDSSSSTRSKYDTFSKMESSFFEIVSKDNNGQKGVRVLPRLESDHYPILLEIKEK